MKIFRGKYGWTTLTTSTNMDGSKNKLYMIVQFPKYEEPIIEELEGDLIFRLESGEEKKCFISNYLKQDGTIAPKLVFNKEESTNHSTWNRVEEYKLNDGENDMFGGKIQEPTDDLPFY